MAQEIVLPFSDTNPHLSPTVFASIEKMPDADKVPLCDWLESAFSSVKIT